MKLVTMQIVLLVGDDEYPAKWIGDAIIQNLEYREGENLISVSVVSEEEHYENT
jgi:hypothetical protein